ncbi:MAG: TlpA disulfide reductase family protein [Halieaceae bacterium]|jgi:thiol-disulfide isomerase/thioredoxin|nr:TlpA disulfide reductase family protein [Halieaceae bacterium]
MMRALLALTLSCLLACTAQEDASGNAVVSRPALGDNWLVINYWASWCAPCREEIPELNRLARRAPELSIYAINFDGIQGEALLAAARDMGIEFTLLDEDPAALLSVETPTVLPTTLIVGPDGAVATRLLGPQTEQGLRRELALAQQNLMEAG